MCARVCVQGRKQVCFSLLFIAFHCSHEEEEEAARHAGACLRMLLEDTLLLHQRAARGVQEGSRG